MNKKMLIAALAAHVAGAVAKTAIDGSAVKDNMGVGGEGTKAWELGVLDMVTTPNVMSMDTAKFVAVPVLAALAAYSKMGGKLPVKIPYINS